MSAIRSGRLAAYAALALPLAAAALPIYVHAPKHYAELGLPLATIGVLLLVLRALDALSDPLLGLLTDRVPERYGGRRVIIAAAVPFLALGMVLLFNPPESGGLGTWLAISLILVYIGLSASSIAYFSIGSAASRDYDERTRITAARGAAALVGVLLAAALPEVLSSRLGREAGFAWFSVFFVVLLLVAAAVTLRFGLPAARLPGAKLEPLRLRALVAPLANPGFRWLALVFLVNGVAAAVPATLVLFYVGDILRRPDLAGAFLAIYFVCGAAGMPLWVRLAHRIGKKHAWLTAMGASVVAFVWAFSLGEGDALAFALVCALSGLAFGADLALPASMLADVIDHDERAGRSRPDGSYFGLWHMLEKFALAAAAGAAFPLLDLLGYRPGTPSLALAGVYALMPCAIRVIAALILLRAPIETPPRVRQRQLEGEAT